MGADSSVIEYENALETVLNEASRYDSRVMNHQLGDYVAASRGMHEQVIAGLSKGDHIKLYTYGMARRGSRGRKYYEGVLANAPYGKCPFCGYGHASTLDHFLPKSLYPYLSVVLNNLVPACQDCNKVKPTRMVAMTTQSSHPYFEDGRIEIDRWLFASVDWASPTTADFCFKAPPLWPRDLIARMSNYFNDYKLADRYSIEAASELVVVNENMSRIGDDNEIEKHLSSVAKVESVVRLNSWKSALYEALFRSCRQ